MEGVSRTQPTLTLASLPVDVLKPIIALVTTEDVITLFMCGNRQMQAQLGDRGCCVVFSARSLASWPRSMTRFRLDVLDLRAPLMLDVPMYFLANVNYSTMPSSLSILNLAFPNALAALTLPDCPPLSSLVPNLTKLSFNKQFVPNFSRERFIQSLPTKLESLRLPFNISFGIRACALLPGTLNDLDLTLIPVEGDDVELWKSSPWFRTIESLSITTMPDLVIKEMVPPNVVKFGHDHPFSLPDRLKISEYCPIPEMHSYGYDRPVRSTISFDDDYFNYLPVTIEYLTIDSSAEIPVPLSCLRLLPKNLTTLHGIHFPSSATMNEILPLLPRTLRSLDTPRMSLSDPSLISMFPPNLTEWDGLIFINSSDSTELISSSNTANERVFEIPRGWKDLYLSFLTDNQLAHLPVQLKRLSITQDFHLSSQSMQKFRNLAVQDIDFNLRVNSYRMESFLQCLPTCLLSLSIDGPFPSSFDWTHILPTPLQYLSLRHQGGQPVSSNFWTSLPSHLRTLTVSCSYTESFPPNMHWMPRSLTRFYFNCNAHKTKISQTLLLTDAHLVGLPPHLEELELAGIPHQFSREALLRLPKNCAVVRLADPHRLPSSMEFPGITHKKPYVSARNAEEVFDFLQKLPKFMLFERGGWLPGWTKIQQYSLLEDLSAACPNVNFGSLPVASTRTTWNSLAPPISNDEISESSNSGAAVGSVGEPLPPPPSTKDSADSCTIS